MLETLEAQGVVHVFGVPIAKIDSVFNRPQLSIQMKCPAKTEPYDLTPEVNSFWAFP
jgi:hypothetical protein